MSSIAAAAGIHLSGNSKLRVLGGSLSIDSAPVILAEGMSSVIIEEGNVSSADAFAIESDGFATVRINNGRFFGTPDALDHRRNVLG